MCSESCAGKFRKLEEKDITTNGEKKAPQIFEDQNEFSAVLFDYKLMIFGHSSEYHLVEKSAPQIFEEQS